MVDQVVKNLQCLYACLFFATVGPELYIHMHGIVL